MSTETSKTMLELSKDLMKDHADTRRLLTMKAAIMIGIGSLMVSDGVGHGVVPVIGYVFAFLSIACGLYATWTRVDVTGPRLERAGEILQEYGTEKGMTWISEANIMACNGNAKNISRSAMAVNVGIIALVVAGMLLSMPPDWVEIILAWLGR